MPRKLVTSTHDDRYETEPIFQIKKINTETTNAHTPATGEKKYQLAGLADFDIQRNGLVYEVTVNERKSNDNVARLQITVTNREDKKDSDYLLIRDTGLSPRSIEEFLTSRIAVHPVQDEKTKQLKI